MRESQHSASMPVLDRRQMLGGLAAYAAMAAAGLMPNRATYAADGDADLVIRNGRVLLIDKRFQQAEAIAIRDGRVLAVGADRDIRRNIQSYAADRCRWRNGTAGYQRHALSSQRRWPQSAALYARRQQEVCRGTRRRSADGRRAGQGVGFLDPRRRLAGIGDAAHCDGDRPCVP
jgi:hypothetical protein